MAEYKVIDRRGERNEEEASTPSSKPAPVIAPPTPVPQKVDIEPLYDRIVVFPDNDEKLSAGGIILTPGTGEVMKSGTVVRVGEGYVSDRGEVRKLRLQPGDRVMYGLWAGSEIEIGGVIFIVMKEAMVFCKLTNGS